LRRSPLKLAFFPLPLSMLWGARGGHLSSVGCESTRPSSHPWWKHPWPPNPTPPLLTVKPVPPPPESSPPLVFPRCNSNVPPQFTCSGPGPLPPKETGCLGELLRQFFCSLPPPQPRGKAVCPPPPPPPPRFSGRKHLISLFVSVIGPWVLGLSPPTHCGL